MGRRILIIEDNPLNMKLTTRLVTIDGMEALTASNAEDGIKTALKEEPDLILMDIQLPGMNGLDATRFIRSCEKISKIPVIALSAHAMPEEKEKAREAGCNGYITKPIDTRAFFQTLRSYLPETGHGSEENRMDKKSVDILQKKVETIAALEPLVLFIGIDKKDVAKIMSATEKDFFRTVVFSDTRQALEFLKSESADLVCSLSVLPDSDAAFLCRQIKTSASCNSIMIIGKKNDAGMKADAMNAGCDDYVGMPLPVAEIADRITALVNKKKRAVFSGNEDLSASGAIKDSATGFYSYPYFRYCLDFEIKRSILQKSQFVLVMMGVRDFRVYDSTWGKVAGEKIITEAASVIMSNIRKMDFPVKCDGAVFAIILSDISKKDAVIIAKRIQKSIYESVCRTVFNDNRKPVSMNGALAIYPSDSSDAESLIKIALEKLGMAMNQ